MVGCLFLLLIVGFVIDLTKRVAHRHVIRFARHNLQQNALERRVQLVIYFFGFEFDDRLAALSLDRLLV